MKRSRIRTEQIACALRQAEAGTAVSDVCRQPGISEATFYVRKRRYANRGMTEIRQPRQLRDENPKLKRLMADLTIGRSILAEIVRNIVRSRDSGARS